MDMRIKYLGEEYPETEIAISNLRRMYSLLRRLEDSINLLEKALNLQIKSHGFENATILSLLAPWHTVISISDESTIPSCYSNTVNISERPRCLKKAAEHSEVPPRLELLAQSSDSTTQLKYSRVERV